MTNLRTHAMPYETMMSPRPVASLVVGLMVGVGGCIFGGQSTDDGFGLCEPHVTPLDDDQPSPILGLAPQDVLDWALGNHRLEAAWQAPREGLQWSPLPGEVEVQLELSRGDGTAEELSGCVEPAIRVPVRLSIETADGALDESIVGTLRAKRADFAAVDALLDFDTLRGNLTVGSSTPDLQLVQPSIGIRMTPEGGLVNARALSSSTRPSSGR